MRWSYLWNALKNLFDGTLKEDCVTSFAEPDFEFRLSSAKRLYSEPRKIIYRDGYIDVDIDMDMIIHFWCEGGKRPFKQYELEFIWFKQNRG